MKFLLVNLIMYNVCINESYIFSWIYMFGKYVEVMNYLKYGG